MKTELGATPLLAQLDIQTKAAKNPETAAKDFEALLLGQMLRSARECGEGGWLGSGQDQTSTQATELAEEHLSKALASQGGIGIAASIQRMMNRDAKTQASAEKLPA